MNKTAIWIIFWCCILAFWAVTAFWIFGRDGRDTVAVVADTGGEPKTSPPPETVPKTEPKQDQGPPKVDAKPLADKTTPKKTESPKKPVADKKPSADKPKTDKPAPKTPAKKDVAAKKPKRDKVAPPTKKEESPEVIAAKKAKAAKEAKDAREYKETHVDHANAFWVYLTTSRVPYTQWALAEGPVTLPQGPQPSSTARVYLNQQAAANTQKFSYDSVIVAEELDAQGNVATVTVWHCVAPGYSKKTNDWYWIQFDAKGKVLKSVADK